MADAAETDLDDIRAVVAGVPDPEIPVVSIVELGMLREIRRADDGAREVVLSPTYTGCPATDAIRRDVEQALADAGIDDVRVRYRLTPPWTTDWITDQGREKLRRFGIAPPRGPRGGTVPEDIPCPHCGTADCELVSEFGSTPCKAAMRCRSCREPFDYFKCL